MCSNTSLHFRFTPASQVDDKVTVQKKSNGNIFVQLNVPTPQTFSFPPDMEAWDPLSPMHSKNFPLEDAWDPAAVRRISLGGDVRGDDGDVEGHDGDDAWDPEAVRRLSVESASPAMGEL